MKKAGFVIHPTHSEPEHIRGTLARRFSVIGKLPPGLVKHLFPLIPVKKLRCGQSDPIISPTGASCTMTFWGVPYAPDQMVELQPVDRVIEAARFLRKEGCDNIGLGAYTSIVGHGGKEVAEALKHGVTTGNSLTAATGVEGLLAAATKVGYDVQDRSLKALVIGGGGSIGRVCAHLLKEQMGGEILLAGRDRTPLEKVAKEIGHRAQILQLSQAIAQADLIVTVTSATGELDINPSLFKSGAVVLDIARPRDIGEAVRKSRTDILVIDGAILSTPNSADMGFDFGFPQGTVYACMAETLVLTLEGVKDNYSIGRDLDLIRVKHIAELAKKHGFKLCSWRGSDEVIPDSKFDQIRQIVTNRRK